MSSSGEQQRQWRAVSSSEQWRAVKFPLQTADGLAGDMFTHAGAMLHEGCPVTSGTRCILVGFVAVDVSVSTARDLFRWNQRMKSAPDNELDDVTALNKSWQAVQATPEEDKWLQGSQFASWNQQPSEVVGMCCILLLARICSPTSCSLTAALTWQRTVD